MGTEYPLSQGKTGKKQNSANCLELYFLYFKPLAS
jgi:hypothetical protein